MDRSSRPALRARDVVAVVLPPGPEWVPVVRGAWEIGAAVLPVDARLSPAGVSRVLEHARPTVIISTGEARRVEGEAAPDGVAVLVATSGSTGHPRVVELTRDAVTAAVTTSAAAIDARAADRWLCCIPVAHIGGLLVLLRHVILGAPLTVHQRFDVKDFCAAGDVRFASIVPTQLQRLLDSGCDLAHLRGLVVGGAALSGALTARAATERLHVFATYGLTESCGGVVYNGTPLRGTEVRVTADGEVQLRGPTLMRGYRFDDEATAHALTADGWLRTHDAGELSADGRLRVHGRLDDVIVSGGEKIWPLELEAVLALHPQVAEIAISKRPDAEWGERAVAFVVARSRDDPPTLDSLRDFAAQHLARYKAPRELVIVESLDRTALGKVRRGRLTT